jgi:chloramphenicol 3-O phosphotransferase
LRLGGHVRLNEERDAVIARILVLTGASSTGKTTIAKELQRLASRPTVFISADDFDLPRDARPLAALREREDDETEALQMAMFRAFYEGLTRWPENGVNAIAETIFRDETQLRICRTTLVNVPHAIVRLICDREVRLARECQRQDRRLGLSEETVLAEVIPDRLDLELDTTDLSPADAARRLLPFL